MAKSGIENGGRRRGGSKKTSFLDEAAGGAVPQQHQDGGSTLADTKGGDSLAGLLKTLEEKGPKTPVVDNADAPVVSSSPIDSKATHSRVGKVTRKVSAAPTTEHGAIPLAPEGGAKDASDYDTRAATLLGNKTLSTKGGSISISDNVRAFEGTMEALIPNIKKTAGFHIQLKRSKIDTAEFAKLNALIKSAENKGLTSIDAPLGTKTVTLSLEEARDKYAKLEEGLFTRRQGIQQKADELLRDEEVLKKADALRVKTTEKVDAVLNEKLAAAKNDPKLLEQVGKDTALLQDALNQIHEFDPKDGTEHFGRENRARLANANAVVSTLLTKYGVRPAIEADLGAGDATSVPPVVSTPPAPAITSSPIAAAPVTAAPSATSPSKDIAPKARAVRKKPMPKMRESDLKAPQKKEGREMVEEDIMGRQMTEADLDQNKVEHGPREMVEGDLRKYTSEELERASQAKAQESEYGPEGKPFKAEGTPERKLTAEDLGKYTPEQLERFAIYRGAAAQQGARIEAEATKKGFMETMRGFSARYRSMHWSKKLAIGAGFAGLTAVGLTGMAAGSFACGAIAAVGWGGGRALAAIGTWGMLDQATSKMKNRYLAGAISIGGAVAMAFGAPRLAQLLESQTGIGHWLAEKLGITCAPPTPSAPAGPTSGPSTPQVPSAPVAPTLSAITVGKGDTVWGIVEKNLNQTTEFSSLDRAGKDFALDTYMKKLGAMTPTELKALGFASGDINKIQIGEKLQLPVLQDQALLNKAVDGANALSTDQKANILKYRADAGTGGVSVAPSTSSLSIEQVAKVTGNYNKAVGDIFGNNIDRFNKLVSWRSATDVLYEANLDPNKFAAESRMNLTEVGKLRDELSRLKREAIPGRTVTDLLRAGAARDAAL